MTVVASGLLVWANDMVLAVLDRFATENGVELIPVTMLVSPLPHRLEHVTLNLNVIVSDRWVVERTKDVIDDFVHGNIWMFPCVKHAAGFGLADVQGSSRALLRLTVRHIEVQ